MSKISLGDLRALLAAEKADALSAMSASKLSEERSRALDYYLGDMSRDMPAPEGRSKAVSSDVADTIEGLMPTLMEIFCGGDEVVRFEPVGPVDVAAAEQEMHRDLCCKGLPQWVLDAEDACHALSPRKSRIVVALVWASCLFAAGNAQPSPVRMISIV
jgi:hypothetical protein